MPTRKAVYAASLDPITNGHLNVIERVAPLFDELTVVVAVDSRKSYMFTPDERVSMAKAAVVHLPNVKVDVVIGGYVVKYAASHKASVIVRGLRNFADLEGEQVLAIENRRIAPSVETLLVPCLPELVQVSSSMVKSHMGADPEWEDQVACSVPAAVLLKLKEKYILSKAIKHWASLMAEIGNPKGAKDVFNRLVKAYGEPHRFYHTLEHIVEMLDEAELAIGSFQNPVAVMLAIWFHDSVYETGKSDNRAVYFSETLSASKAEQELARLELPTSLIEVVKSLIMVTSYAAKANDNDACYLSDLDLAILGKSPKKFDLYEQQIRQEYAHVADDLFRERRKMILRRIIDERPLFQTEPFRRQYETVARDNLARSIAKLEQ